MILDKFCNIILNSKNIEFYKNLGYDTSKKEITIQITDLNTGSHKKILVSCDICNKEKHLPYREYNRSILNRGIYCCSSKCSSFKSKLTNLERLGVDNPTKSIDIIKKREKSNLEKYGVKNTLELESIKNSIKLTNLKKYGFKNPTMNKDIYSKVSNTIFNKYGDKVIFKTEYFKNNKNNYYRNHTNSNFINDIKNKLSIDNINLLNIIDGVYIISCKHCNDNFFISPDLLYKRHKVYNTIICTNCNPIFNYSSIENEFYTFLASIYKGKIIRNTRDIISPYELDFYLPNLKMSIEFNGIYWHSNIYKDKNYHTNKYHKCLEKGINLISIWEDDWIYKKEIIKSLIKVKIKLVSKRIYARKCNIVVFDNNKLTKAFLNENHLQGDCKSNIKIGLMFENKLVCLMTFSKYRYGVGKMHADDYELSRYCVSKDYIIIGGASKLLKYFMNNFSYRKIISFSDNDISDGLIYKKLGFIFSGFINPTYYYIINGKREHRFKWRKSNLLKKGILKKGETEYSCMDRLGINRVYNTGHRKFVIIK